jgi:uncharacterized protein YbjT (DUF2867 family)
MDARSHPTILVTGGTGTLGRLVVVRLLAAAGPSGPAPPSRRTGPSAAGRGRTSWPSAWAVRGLTPSGRS